MELPTASQVRKISSHPLVGEIGEDKEVVGEEEATRLQAQPTRGIHSLPSRQLHSEDRPLKAIIDGKTYSKIKDHKALTLRSALARS